MPEFLLVGCGQAVVVCCKHRQRPPSQGLRLARPIWDGSFANCKFRHRSVERHGYFAFTNDVRPIDVVHVGDAAA